MLDFLDQRKKLTTDPHCIENPPLLLRSNNLIFVQVLIVGGKRKKHRSYCDCQYEHTSVTGKLFKHLALGNPILALNGESPAKKIVTETDSSRMIDPEDIEEIKKVVLFCYNLYRDGKLQTRQRKDIIRHFEKKVNRGTR